MQKEIVVTVFQIDHLLEADHPMEEIVLETEEEEVFLEVTGEMMDQIFIFQNL